MAMIIVEQIINKYNSNNILKLLASNTMLYILNTFCLNYMINNNCMKDKISIHQKVLHYEISHCDFSFRFKKIRQQRSIDFGEYLLFKDNNTKERVMGIVCEYDAKQQLDSVLQQVQRLLPLTNNNRIGCFAKLIGYSLNESKAKKQLLLIYEFHSNTMDEEFKSMNLQKKEFTQADITKFLQQMLRNYTQLEKMNLNHGCLSAQNILLSSLDSIQCSFKMLYAPNMNINLSNILKNSTKQYMLHENQTQYRISLEDCVSLNLSLVQLNNIASQKVMTYDQKQMSDRQKLGLLALRMLNHQNRKLYTYDEGNQLKWNDSEILNILKSSKYEKSIIKIIEILLYQQQFYSFQALEQKANILLSKSNQRLTNSRRSKVSYEGNISMPKTPVSSKNKANALKLSREILLLSTSPKKAPTMSIEQLQAKVLLDVKGNPLPRVSQKIYPDGGKFLGQFSNETRQGNGIYYYPQGDVYGGQWKDNAMEGYGMYLFNNGQTYEGEVKLGLKHGSGTYIYANGNKYSGEWSNDKKNGRGYYQYNHRGDSYAGTFEAGIRNGAGIYKWKNGNIYKGNFSKGEKHGQGQGLLSNGTKINGKWYNDQLQGIVKVKFKRGDQFVGQVKENNFNGLGKYKYIEGTQYEGQFIKGQKTGKCQINYPNGDKYEGQVQNGKCEGKGVYHYRNQGIRYEGTWHNGLQHGKGTLVFQNGTIISMEWKLGKPNENGFIIYANGDQYEGKINSMGRHGRGTYKFKDGRILEGNFCDGQAIF